MDSPEFHIATGTRRDYPELARIAAGHGVLVIEDAEAQAADALDEIQQLRVKVRRLRIVQDSLLDWIGGVDREAAAVLERARREA